MLSVLRVSSVMVALPSNRTKVTKTVSGNYCSCSLGCSTRHIWQGAFDVCDAQWLLVLCWLRMDLGTLNFSVIDTAGPSGNCIVSWRKAFITDPPSTAKMLCACVKENCRENKDSFEVKAESKHMSGRFFGGEGTYYIFPQAYLTPNPPVLHKNSTASTWVHMFPTEHTIKTVTIKREKTFVFIFP